MRITRRLLRVAVLLVLVASPCMRAQNHNPPASGLSTPASAYDLDSFRGELDRISAILDNKPSSSQKAALRSSLPATWTISTPNRQYSLSTEPLRKSLNDTSSDEARRWVAHLQEHLTPYAPPIRSSQESRTQLDKILAQPEFRTVRPPSAWEILRQRINAWLIRLFEKLFGGIARYPLGGQILFWVIVVIAVGAIAAFLFRFVSSRDQVVALPRAAEAIPGRTWQEWIRAAREAASAGNYREAVHSAYWAGIARLEDLNVLPKDRTKTPREYLRLVVEPAPGELAAPAAHRQPLTALTQRLERVWYADRGASSEDFRESLRQLEALGCPLQ